MLPAAVLQLVRALQRYQAHLWISVAAAFLASIQLMLLAPISGLDPYCSGWQIQIESWNSPTPQSLSLLQGP